MNSDRTEVDVCHQTVEITVDCSADPPTATMTKIVSPVSWSGCKEEFDVTYHLDEHSAGRAVVYLPTTDFLRFQAQPPENHVVVLSAGESVVVTANGEGSGLVYVYADCPDRETMTASGAVAVIIIDP